MRRAHIRQLAFAVNSTTECLPEPSPTDKSLVINCRSWFGLSMARHHRARAGGERGSAAAGSFWLYGVHPARAALRNAGRTILRAVVTDGAWRELERDWRGDLETRPAATAKIAQMLPPGAVHQGVALLCEPLPSPDLAQVIEAETPGRRRIAVLDQITDPHNEGAILRSAAAFGLTAVVVQDRHSPPESGVLAKAASGALDLVPRVTVVNIARALEEMGRLGIWRIALASDGAENLRESLAAGDVAVVLGAEGGGLRRLVRERCDTSGSIPMEAKMASLNVSNAAAIAFYEIARSRK